MEKKLSFHWLDAVFSVLLGIVIAIFSLPVIGILLWRANVVREEVLGLSVIEIPAPFTISIIVIIFLLTVSISRKKLLKEKH